jgi:hypothetical protein
MAISILNNIDLNQNQLLNVVIQVLATPPGSPVEGQVYFNSTDDTFYGWDGSAWLDLGNQGTGGTDLSTSRTATTVDVISDTGADATLPAATGTLAGVMTAADKSKLDGIEAGATADQNASEVSVTPNGNLGSTDVQSALEELQTDVDNLSGGLVYKGGYNANANTPNLESGAGVLTGDTYTVITGGLFFTEQVDPGDVLIAEIDGASTLGDWTVVNKNIPEIVDASETEKGLVEEATQVEVDAGTDIGGTGAKLFVTPSKLQSALGNIGTLNEYTQLIGNGAATSIDVTHNLGNQDVQSQVFDTGTNQQVLTEVVNTSANVTTFNFNVAPASNEYRVVIQG